MKYALSAGVILVTLLASCSLDTDKVFTVSNNSSYTVNMTYIENADKDEILNILPGTKEKLTFKVKSGADLQVSFTYSPSNLVTSKIDTGANKITFTNR